MNIRLLIPLENLNLIGNKSFMINNFLITNDLSIKQKFLDSPSFLRHFGQCAIDSIKENVFIVYKGESKGFELIAQCESIEEIAHKIGGYINHMLFCSWFVKDNSIYATGTYVELLEQSGDGQDIGVQGCYSSGSVYNTNSECKNAKVSFGLTDLEHLNSYFDRTQDFGQQSEETKNVLLPIAPGSNIKQGSLGKITYKIDRVSRAFLFLQLVRRTEIPFFKISYQMALFECLFTIGTTDSTYQVTRHPALYLGGSLAEINENIKFIDDAYNVRSKFFHGDILRDYPSDLLIDMNKRLEELSRIILLRAMKEPGLFINSTSTKQKSLYRAYWRNRSLELGYEYVLPSASKKCIYNKNINTLA
ncbi:hypothetical protein QG516_25780 [Pedobacter gandavensis]|uniref:hypothetical protein n=1 Tax=Pedobacter gandavensis TaxID=2679963 RepID=UPI00247A4385|nr:hypothetical protein [Pedobacter gandavensis]WGQ09927.1 hypothetical protein QG516_25780 [Pedobacter gandavensis]